MYDTYVVNLKRCKNRLATFDTNMKKLNIQYIRWDAIEGKEHRHKKNFVCRNFTCNNGIIGCYMSHVTLWKHILETSKKDWHLVMEDDTVLTKKALENMDAIFDDINKWNYHQPYPEMINIACNVLCKSKKITEHLYIPGSVNGTAAYLISNEGIRKALELIDKDIITHIDLTLYINIMRTNYLHYYATDNFIENNDGFESSVSTTTFPVIETSMLNWLLYRISKTNSTYAVFNAFIFGNSKVGFNILILWSIAFISVVLQKRYYLVALMYVILQILAWLVIKRRPSSGC